MNITEEASIHVRAGGDEQRVLPVSDMQSGIYSKASLTELHQ
jgi:hypothetical protein